jgi:hypothetical protein
MLLAAPRKNKFPAIVLPADNAINCFIVVPVWFKSGRYKETKGTFDINWL